MQSEHKTTLNMVQMHPMSIFEGGGVIFRTHIYHFLGIFGKKASNFALQDVFLNVKPNEII